MKRWSTERPLRRSRRALAPLVGVVLLAVAVAERLRRRATTKEGSMEMMLETNKAVSRRIVEEAFSEGRYDVIEELVAPTFVNHDPSVTDDLKGPAGVRQLIETYRSAFPDLRLTVEDQLAEGDKVATRWTARGTHQGELLGIAPTGKESTVTGLTIDRIADGKIVESWNNWDTLGMLQQIGVVPTLAPA